MRCVCGCSASYHRGGTGACSVCALEDVQCFQFRPEPTTSAAIPRPSHSWPPPTEVARPILLGILLGLGMAGLLAQGHKVAPAPCVCADQDRATAQWRASKCLDPECREVKLGGPEGVYP